MDCLVRRVVSAVTRDPEEIGSGATSSVEDAVGAIEAIGSERD